MMRKNAWQGLSDRRQEATLGDLLAAEDQHG